MKVFLSILKALEEAKSGQWTDYLIYGSLLLMTAVLPSVVIPELMFPTQTGKFFSFSYVMAGITVLCLLKILFSEEVSFKVNIIDILLAILLIYISVNRYFVQDIYGFSLRFYELLGLSVLYIILRKCHSKVYPYLFLAIVISGIIQAVYGNLQLYGYYPSHHSGFKMTGSFFNPGPYAGFLASVFPIALGMYLFQKEGENKLLNLIFKYVPLLGVVSTLLVLPATQSRAAWLGVAASTSLLFIYKYRLINKLSKILDTQVKKILAFSMVVLIMCSICTGMYYYKQGSADGRILIWKVTANMIKDRPIFGFGHDRFKAHYMDYQADYFRSNPDSKEGILADETYYAFNTPLQFMTENGLVGMLLALPILFYLLFKNGKKKGFPERYIAQSGLVAAVMFGLFSYPSHILDIKLILIIVLAILSTYQEQYWFMWQLKHNRYKTLSISFKILTFVAVLASFAYVSNVQIQKLYSSFATWKNAMGFYHASQYAESIRLYESAYHIFQNDGEFLIYYGQALSKKGSHSKAIEVLEESTKFLSASTTQIVMGDNYQLLEDFCAAENAYLSVSKMVPGRFYPKYLLAKLFMEQGETEKAVALAKELLTKPVKVPSPAIEEIREEMQVLLERISDESPG